MENESNAYPIPVMAMELDILQFTYESNEFGPSDGNLTADVRLKRKYKSLREQQQLRVMMDFLEDERFLYRYSGPYQGRGITPKGLDRLNRLKHPHRVWMKENWFALVIALITGASAIAGAVISALLR